MKLNKSLLALVASAMVAGMVYAEGEKPAATDAKHEEKKEAKETKPAKAVKLNLPFSLIEGSLTAEQKESLGKIQAELRESTKKLAAKAEEDSMAVLNDAQKTELKAAQEKKAADMKAAKAADKGEKAKPAEEKK